MASNIDSEKRSLKRQTPQTEAKLPGCPLLLISWVLCVPCAMMPGASTVLLHSYSSYSAAGNAEFIAFIAVS